MGVWRRIQRRNEGRKHWRFRLALVPVECGIMIWGTVSGRQDVCFAGLAFTMLVMLLYTPGDFRQHAARRARKQASFVPPG